MSDSVQNTEIIFKNQNTNVPFSIYGVNKYTCKETVRPQDVISCVSTQLKAYQVADSIKTNKKQSSKELMMYKRSTFLSVNKLPVYVQNPKQDMKLNTQGVTDSQLRSLIETAEILEAHQGMTQEFETDFVQNITENIEETNNLKFETNSGTHIDEHIIKTDLNTDNDCNKSSVLNANETRAIDNTIDVRNSKIVESILNFSSKNAINSNDIKEIENDRNINSTECIQDTEIQASQILTSKTFSKMNNIDKIKSVTDLKQNKHNAITVDHHNCSVTKSDGTTIISDGMCTNNDIYLVTSEYCSRDSVNDNNIREIDKDMNLNENTTNDDIPISQILNTKTTKKRKIIEKEYKLNIESHSKNKAHTQTENYTQMLNQSIETQVDETDRPLSPIFPSNVLKHNTNAAPPLIYNLDKFEHFESIANPIIESLDFETAKHVINSQILNKELHIQINEINLQKRYVSTTTMNDITQSGSPNQNINTKPIQRDKTKSKDSQGSNTSKKTSENNTTKNELSTDILGDEILFSSDEEDGVAAHEQDLPFTCALETSFYDHADVLDKTVYVGFQTASNRSIQVLAGSFARAESLLKDVVSEEITVTDLVNNKKHNTSIEKSKTSLNEEIETDLFVNKVANPNVNYNKIGIISAPRLLASKTDFNQGAELADAETDKFIGFRTANNKNIILSDNSLVRYKKVFQDIDLNEDFKSREMAILNDRDVSDNKLENFNTTSDILQGIDDKILQEFENIDMSLEDNKKGNIENVCEIRNYVHERVPNKNIDKNSSQHKTINAEILVQPNISGTNTKIDIGKTNIEGFKTASNKPINISKDAWAKSKRLFENIDEIVDTTFKHSHKIGKLSNTNRESAHSPKCPDQINLSSDTNQLVKDICGDIPVNQFAIDKNLSSTCKDFVGFRTANNKDIKISEQAMLKSSKMFNDIDSIKLPNKTNKDYSKTSPGDENQHVNYMNRKKPCIENQFIVLKTVNKEHNIETSNAQETWITNTNFDCDGLIKCPVRTPTGIPEICSITKQGNVNAFVPHNEFNGFKTASNKNIKISHKTLSRTKNIFKDIDLMDLGSINKNKKEYPYIDANITLNEMIDYNERDKNLNVVTELKCQSAKIACNKYNEISRGSLIESKHTLEDIYDQNDPCNDLNKSDDKWETRSTSPVFKSEQKDRKTNPVKNLKHNNEILKGFDKSVHRTSGFTGFFTASNKQVNISETALSNSRKILRDIDNISFNNRNVEMKSLYSKETYQKDNNNLNRVTKLNKIDNNSAIKAISESDKSSIPHNTFTGFKTANNKVIKISDEILSRAKNVFQNIDLIDFKLPNTKKKDYPDAETNVKTNNGTSYKETDRKYNDATTNLNDFKRASNTCIVKPADTLIERDMSENNEHNNNSDDQNKVLDKDSNTNDIINRDDNLETRSTSPVFRGFQTGNNKPVTISDKALKKSKELFKDLDKETLLNTPVTSGFVGFQTASNKRVIISEKALVNSKKIFKDIDDINVDCENIKFKPLYPKEIYQNDDIDNPGILFYKNTEILNGFQTASRKPVSISKSALENSKKLFQDIENTTQNKIDDYRSKTNDSMIEVSKNTRNVDIKEINLNISKNKCFIGFQTGNNKRISVTEEALTKSKKLFSEIDDENNESLNKKDKKEITNIIHEELNGLLDTQVMNNFDKSLNTDDFHNTQERSKRSGSPILSCHKVKKRKKFETPYNLTVKPIPKSFNPIKNQSKIKYRDNYKKNKKYTLKDFKQITKDINNEIDPYILEFEYNNLLEFQFNNERNDLLSMNMTIDLLKEYFLDSVNSKLVPNGWLDNHLKLILWKLISYEIKFKTVMCTVRNVLEQLKYRYDKELYNAERPALRKILEKDDIATKTLVLCVVEIYADGVKVSSVTPASSNLEILVTDGWYCIRCTIDKMLTELICINRIVVGTKLVTNGAEIIGCDQGISPWEDTSAVRLKIFGNSTRRARWDAKLGYHGNGAILSQLSSVKVFGGKVSKLRVFITRAYPALYVEKFEDGSTVTRSERLENLHQIKMESDRQIVMEKICEEVEKEFMDQESEDSEGLSDTCRREGIESGSQITKMMKKSKDPLEFIAQLTHTQTRLLEDHTSKNRDKLLQEMQTRVRERIEKAGVCVNRNVVSLLKIRIAGLREKDEKIEITKGMMSIWKPTDSVWDIIKEGAWVDIINVVPTALRLGEIQISAGRQSIFSVSKFKPLEKFKPYINLLQRKCYTIKELAINPTISTEYNEIDTVGFIFLIDPAIDVFDATKQSFQNIYLADADSNIICVHFWGGIKKFGFQNILDTGQVVFCVNLQKRAGNTRKCIPQYRVTELSYFTQTPKNEDAKQILGDLNNKITSLDRKQFCENCISLKNNYSLIKQKNENVSPYRGINNSDINLSKNKIFIDSPLIRQNLQDNLNFSALDFDSTFQKDTELSLEALKRKRKVNEKIAKLEMYGEPPPLTHINIISKKAFSSYKSPILTDNKSNITPKSIQNKHTNDVSKSKYDSDISENVANEKNTPRNCVETDRSVTMNRTYVKCVNPVKINFDLPNDSNIDPFAEEFDTSPPLSLDDY